MEQHESLDHSLLIRYLEEKDQLSPKEQATVAQWIQHSPANQRAWEELQKLWKQSGQVGHLVQLNTAADWQQVWSQIKSSSDDTPVRQLPRSRSWIWQVAAAVVLLVTTIWGVWQFNASAPAQLAQYDYVAQDSMLLVALPDGSEAYLNQGAQLSYNEDFGEQTRIVQLVGEGYFEVVSNAEVPFLVRTEPTTVRVVGTTFNVKQADQAVKVTVNSGKVAFSHQEDTLLLTPNEVGLYQAGTQLQEFANDDPNYLSWKTGTLRFDDTPFPQVIEDLARHYQVSVQMEGEKLHELRLTSAFQHQPLEVVLEEIAIVLDINYTYENNQIIFSYN